MGSGVGVGSGVGGRVGSAGVSGAETTTSTTCSCISSVAAGTAVSCTTTVSEGSEAGVLCTSCETDPHPIRIMIPNRIAVILYECFMPYLFKLRYSLPHFPASVNPVIAAELQIFYKAPSVKSSFAVHISVLSRVLSNPATPK